MHRCACLVRCVACAVSWGTWLLFSGLPARYIVLYVRCLGPLGSYSLVCLLGALCCLCGVLGHLAPIHRCARLVRCVTCAVSWANWLLFTDVLALFRLCIPPIPGVLGFFFVLCIAMHQCARLVRCVACAASWATWLLFTGVHAWRAVLHAQHPGPLGSCSPVGRPGLLCCVCRVSAHFAPLHWCVRWECSGACAVFWTTWLLFTGVPARCVVLCVSLAGSWATWLLFTSVRTGCAVLPVRDVAVRRALVHPDGGCSVAGGRWIRCRPCSRPSGRQLVLPGTCCRAVVCCVLCALLGFTAPGGRCCLATVRMP